MSDDVASISEKLCGALTDMGCAYDIEIDNRGGKRSRYVHVRKPVSAKIRISDHKSDRIEKERGRSKMLVLDVGPHGMHWRDAVKAIERPSPS
jgi:hypothetical protein